MGNDKNTSIHENIYRENEIKHNSERAFGVLFALIFMLVGLYPVFSGGEVTWWPLILAVFFIGATLAFPRLLMPLNLVWIKIGLLLHKVMSPIVMGFIFFVVLTPLGKLMRIFNQTPLRLEFENNLKTYWIARQPPGSKPENMRRQF